MAGEGATSGTISARVSRLSAGLAASLAGALLILAIWFGAAAGLALGLAALALIAGLVIGAGVVLSRLARPLDQLALDLRVIARDNPDHALRIGDKHWLGDLTAALAALQQRLQRWQQESHAALAQATARVEEQKRRLEAILLELNEGIVVCNPQHQVLLYNAAAAAMIEPPLQLGLGRSVFEALTREPLLHALERLAQRETGGTIAPADRFVCATLDGRHVLQARLGLMREDSERPGGYVLVLRDFGRELDAAARRDDLLHTATEGMRAPLANLRAAAETLADHPDLPREQRAEFQRVVLQESAALSERLETLVRGHRELTGTQWSMTEVYSSDLLIWLQRRLEAQPRLEVTATGLPVWIYGDSLALLVLLEHLVRRLSEQLGRSVFDAAFTPADRRVNFDIIWPGKPVATALIDGWLDTPLTGGLGPLTGRAVLHRHGAEAWSQALGAGEACLRLPLPAAEPIAARTARARAVRPEFYDFDLLRWPSPSGELAQRPLRQVSYVVLDVETTGLRPAEGDEVVALAGVRVVNGRVLTMETFDRLVNPQRRIPPESVEFHGITEAMVAGEPPLAVVLPQFHRFAGDSVLVAHNAAFDLAFLSKAAAACGLKFSQPVLDTLLLSAYLDPDEPDHSLDGIAARLGLTFTRRHSALGDALVTAAILVRLLQRLDERGLSRFGAVIDATGMTAQVRARQHQLTNPLP
jgi:DNA polymerase-3 subunit epsilon